MGAYHTKNQTEVVIRSGYTMIELIFVIVIIGILAALVIPKLTATRDDAKLSTDVSNMNICIKDVSGLYTATGTDPSIIYSNSDACSNVVCYNIDINSTHMKVDLNVTGADYCADIQNVGGELVHSYNIAGEAIKR